MHKDRYGLTCTGSAAAVQRLSRAQEHLLRFRPEVVEELDNAIAEDAGCVMARAHDSVAQVHRIAAQEVDLMPGVQRERVPRMSVE